MCRRVTDVVEGVESLRIITGVRSPLLRKEPLSLPRNPFITNGKPYADTLRGSECFTN